MKYLFTVLLTIWVCLLFVGTWFHFNNPAWSFLAVGIVLLPALFTELY